MAKKLEFLLLNEKVRKGMGKNALKLILANWTWEKIGRELEVILKRIVKGNSYANK